MSKSATLTQNEYWTMFELVKGDIEAAIQLNTAYLTIDRLARDDEAVLREYNRFAGFWTINAYAQQSAFFTAFGRIFDDRRDSFSVQKLVAATAENPWFFSKASLRERKRAQSGIMGDDPPWLVDFLDDAKVPATQDFKAVPHLLAPHQAKFKAIYEPIRHQVFAHRSKMSQDAILALFSETLITEVDEILRFLYTVTNSLWHLANNGQRLDLSDTATST
jgi:AbiU2